MVVNSLRNIPLLGHHQDALYQEALEKLGPDTLEQAQGTLVLDNELHNLDEALERLAVANRGRLGLQADLGDDEGLGDDGGNRLGQSAKN